MAENPQQTVRELQELVVEYVKQETVGPLKDLRDHIGWALGGAALLGFGFLFFEIGILRLLQEETYPHLTGNWSWVPYALTVVVAAIIIGIVLMILRRKKASEL